jgi:flagellar basal body-associated protein FliL
MSDSVRRAAERRRVLVIVAAIAIGVAAYGVVVYVAWHFVTKYW